MERKDAIEVVKSNMPDDDFPKLREALETLIPELREGDGERIRKWIIDDIRYNMHEEPLNNTEYKRKGEEAIAWLERLGENIPSKETVLNVWDLGNIWKEITNGASNTEHGTQLDYIIRHWKEGGHYVKPSDDVQEGDGWKEGDVIKYGDSSIVRALVIKGRMAVKSNGGVFTVQYPDEWVKVGSDEKEKFLDELERHCGRWELERGKKPADNAGPKFKPGDWIVCDGNNSAAKIISIDGGRYEAEFIDGSTRFSNVDFVDRNFHLCPVEYCGIDNAGGFILSSGIISSEDSNVKPATKE